jgi:hypothetical protein
MKFGKLRKLVEETPKEYDDCEVYKSKDPEGNGYHQDNGIDLDVFLEDKSYFVESISNRNASAEEVCYDEEDWEKLRKDEKTRVIVIF